VAQAGILAAVPDAIVQGAGAPRLPNTANIRFAGLEGEALVIALDLRGFAVSSGAACSSAPSSLRRRCWRWVNQDRSQELHAVSLGESNSEEEVDALIAAVAAAVTHLRKLSPTYV
jgi:cysteine desulfurase